MSLSKNQKRDYQKYFVAKGDKDFSPKHNEFIIEKTIRANELLRKQKKQQYAEKIQERAEAVASYLKSNAINSGKPIDQYLGKRGLAYMRGQQIVQRIKQLKDGTQVITIN